MLFGFIQKMSVTTFMIAAYPLTAEQYPTGIRSTAVATTDGIGHFGGAIAAPLILAVNAHAGFTGSFAFMGATMVIGALFATFARKATGKSLNVVNAAEAPLVQAMVVAPESA